MLKIYNDNNPSLETDTFVITTDVSVTNNLPDDNYSLWFEIPNDKLVSYDTKNKDVTFIAGEKTSIIALSNTSFTNFNFTFKARNFDTNFGLNFNIDSSEPTDAKLAGKATITKNNKAYAEQTFNLDYFNVATVLIGKE